MERYQGRPAHTDGRLPKELDTYDLLDRLGVPFDRVDHDPAMTMEACAAVDQTLDAVMCKNLFLCNRQETQFYLLMIPGGKKFKTKDLSAQLGVARLSFAGEDSLLSLLGLTPGSVTAMGLQNDAAGRVQLLIDEELRKADYVGCHPCINTSSIRLKTADFLDVVLPAMRHTPIFVTLPDHAGESEAAQ